MTQRRWPRWIGFVISILILTVIVVGGYCGFLAISAAREKGKQADSEATERPPVPVRVAKVERRKLTPTFEVIGTVMAAPERFSTLAAATTGLVDKLVVQEGTRVEKNALVIQLDERPAQLALTRAETAYARLVAKPRPQELTQARALVAKMKSAHGLAESRLKRAKDLRARSPELVPDVQLLDEERNEQTAKAEREIAEAQLQLLEKGPRDEVRRESQVEVEAAKLQLAYCRVTTPFAGEVIEIKTRVGQRADVGTPLITILDTTEVLVQARVPGNRLVGLWAAMKAADKRSPATIRCACFSGEVFPAQGGWLNQQTEALTSDVPVKLRVPNPKGLLRVGMTVQVELFEPEVECVAVPEAAISVNEEGHRVVTVIRDGKAVPTEIEIASKTEPEIRAGGWVRVIKGLDAGDEVAVENGYALPKDTPVTIQPPRS
jgi:multidrug efflux pump subunit AcrA (membrane-fusion protein)